MMGTIQFYRLNSHDLKRRLRRLLPAVFIDTDADFEQSHTMCLHELHFRLIVVVRHGIIGSEADASGWA